MKALTVTHDNRIDADNFLLELSAEEYLRFAKKALEKNEFQRRRVRSTANPYALLKEDIKRGCVIPPIVVALSSTKEDITLRNICDILQIAENVLILDGLQRTYTLIELEKDLQHSEDENGLAKFYKGKLRLEVYCSINRLGILYRMLTLNAGQTPMSLRQQVEMLYIDYSKIPIDEISLIREADDDVPSKLGHYVFKSMIEGFMAYLERNELPIDKFDLLESVRSLEKLATERSDASLFETFVRTYDKFVHKFSNLSGSIECTSEGLGISGQPFGKDVRRVFTKSQPLTGFGSALGKLKDFTAIQSLDEVLTQIIPNLKTSGSGKDAFEALLYKLEKIRLSSKKIGNSQRLYFHFFFRELLNKDGDSYCDIAKAIENAFQKYQVQMG